MTLKEYLDNHKIMRYIRGTRIPNKEIMKVIFNKTNGKVTPNDFYQEIWNK
jgi:hypothetical protein